jgi:hypothetical protein
MHSYSIFQEPWWLEAVAPGEWKSLEVTNGVEIVARLPIVLRRQYGIRIIYQPPLTPTLGPWIRPSKATHGRQLAEQRKLFYALIDRLPNWDYCRIVFNYRLTNWLPFYWRGFKQTTYYSYLLNDIFDLDKTWRQLQANVRGPIRNAEKRLLVRNDLPIDCLLDMVALTFARQGRKLPFPRDLVKRIDAACSSRNARQLFVAQDQEGRIHAAVYLVMDNEYAYALLAGGDPQLRGSGAQTLLYWEAIKFASRMNLKFDFEGSMLEPIEHVYRAFGGVQVPILHVFAAKPLVKAFLLVRELVQN